MISYKGMDGAKVADMATASVIELVQRMHSMEDDVKFARKAARYLYNSDMDASDKADALAIWPWLKDEL